MPRKSAPFPRILLVIACVLLISMAVSAQSQANSGNIEGRVLDPNGAAVPGAMVTAVNQETGFEKSTSTNDGGEFILFLLPPGVYSVRVTATGFSTTAIKDVTVTVGSHVPLEVKLPVGATSATVTIIEPVPLVESTRTSVATTINQQSIDNLPINGRNFQDFATLSPAVVRDPRGGDLSVGGQRGTFNSLQVDGVDNNNTFFGQAFGRGGVRPPYQFSEESVKEFQVNQNGFSAEFGRAGGAVINVVTKSGTNQFHGGGFEYFRDESLNANDPLAKAAQFRAGLPNKRAKLQINQFGARLGGPIRRNRAFFFFTYDGQRANVPQIMDVPNIGGAPAAARAILVPKIHTYQIGRKQDVFLGKSDIKLNDRNQLVFRYNRQNFNGKNNENNGLTSAEEHTGDSRVKSDTFSTALTSTVTNTIVNELRVQLARDREPGLANSDAPEANIGASVSTSSGTTLTIGRNNFSPRETTIKRLQFIDNVSYLRGRSSWKFGLDFNFDRIFNFFPGLFSGAYTFTNFTNFANNVPASYTQNFAGAGTTGGTTHPNLSEYSFYGQNDLRWNSKLTLNLGVRYDYEGMACSKIRNPNALLLANGFDTSTCPKDKNNFAPRVGASYALDENTVIRAGFGIYYNRTPAIVVGTAHSQNGIQVTGINLNCSTASCPTYPNSFSAPPGAISNPNLFLFAKDYVQPYVEQGRLGFERQFAKNLSFAATYMYYHGLHLTRTRDVNLLPPVLTPISTTTPSPVQTFFFLRFPGRPNAAFSRISIFESAARSVYHGLSFQLTQRLTHGFQFMAAYTMSTSRDEKPDQTIVVVGADDAKIVANQLNPQADYGRSDTDIPRRFVFSPVYEWGKIKWTDNAVARVLFSDYTLSSIIQFQSGTPYSALVSGDPNNDGNRATDRLPGTIRNQFRTPAIYQFDARVTRSIRFSENMRLRLIVEAFNVFNRANVATVNSTIYAFAGGTLNLPSVVTAFGTPRSFGSPASGTTTFATPRQIQLGIKFDF